MFTAFGNDKSSYRTKILLLILSTLLLFISIFVMYQMCITKVQDNNKLAATYQVQEKWLNNFNYKDAIELEKSILKPCKKADVEKIKQQQLDILKNHSLTLLSVRSGNAIEDKKTKLSYVKTNVTVSGGWDNLAAALNEFEKKNLVVITNCEISPKNSGVLETNLEFATYFN